MRVIKIASKMKLDPQLLEFIKTIRSNSSDLRMVGYWNSDMNEQIDIDVG